MGKFWSFTIWWATSYGSNLNTRRPRLTWREKSARLRGRISSGFAERWGRKAILMVYEYLRRRNKHPGTLTTGERAGLKTKARRLTYVVKPSLIRTLFPS